MPNRLVDIDVGTLDRATRILGTGTIKETVDAALGEPVCCRRREHVDRAALRLFAAAATRDVADDEVRTQAWR